LRTFSQRLTQLVARDHDRVGDKGRTILRLHGERRPRAVVLLHGLTSSPAQFERFAGTLYERGHNVIVPRLPRHGHADRLTTALARLRPDELYAAAASYIEVARELGEHVTVAGFSLGGLLAAWIAQHHDVDRAVAIAPFFGVAWIPGFFMSGISELALRIPNRFEWWDPVLRERQQPEHGYPRYPTHAVAHAFRLASRILRDASHVAPRARQIVLVVNAGESTVDNRAIARLYRKWHTHSPQSVELLTLEGLPLSHDVVEPLHYTELADRAFPFLLRAIDPQSA
jgi:esterase/lipase